MSTFETSVFEVTVGDFEAAGDHLHFGVLAEAGGATLGQRKAELTALLGFEPVPAVFYLVIPTASEEHAANLVVALQTAKQEAMEEGATHFAAMIFKSVSEKLTITQDVFAHGVNVIITLEPPPTMQKRGSSVEEQIGNEAGEALGVRNHFSLSLDFGTTFSTLLNSNSMIMELFNTCGFRMEVGLAVDIGTIISRVAVEQEWGEVGKIVAQVATLYKNAELRLKFASASHLPESIQAMLPPTDFVTSQKNAALLMMSQKDRTLLNKLAEFGAGKAFLHVVATHSVTCVDLKMPGLGKLFTFDISGRKEQSS